MVVSNRVSVPSADSAKRAGGLEVALRPALRNNGGWFGIYFRSACQSTP